jgi:TRAP-type C4-dicarboxylate transport system permease small subunit
METVRNFVARYWRALCNAVAYFIFCLAIGLLGFGLILLAWTAGSPMLAIAVMGLYIMVLIFGPIQKWLTQLVNTGTLDLHQPAPA